MERDARSALSHGSRTAATLRARARQYVCDGAESAEDAAIKARGAAAAGFAPRTGSVFLRRKSKWHYLQVAELRSRLLSRQMVQWISRLTEI